MLESRLRHLVLDIARLNILVGSLFQNLCGLGLRVHILELPVLEVE
jgi:hypothetical protein